MTLNDEGMKSMPIREVPVKSEGGRLMELDLDKNSPSTYRWWEDAGWAVIIWVSSFAIGIGIGLEAYFLVRRMGDASWSRSETFATVVTAIPAEISCIWLVMIRARRVGGSDLVRSLAAGPISYSRVFMGVMVFELGGTAYALVRMLMLPEHAALRHHVYFPLVAAFRAGPILATGYVLMITLFAPISEELFFRGWLWTALRPSWGIWPTALFTGGFWWISHAYWEPRALPFLLLTAVILLIPQHYT